MDDFNSDAMSTSEAVTLPEFKDIRKPTISETYKYFNKLLKGKTIANLNEFISLNTDLSLFDESLKLMLIDSLHLQNEVFRILISQNDLQIKRILHCDWFFRDLPAEFCINQIFPFVSLSVRCKIINKLSRHLISTEEAEKYFAFIKAKYDSARASFMLPRCSQQFILAFLEETKTPLNFSGGIRILMNITKRYPEVGVKILLKGELCNNFSKYKKVLLYLCGYHPNLILPFLKEYTSVIPRGTFGRKLTKKLVPKLRECLFPNLIKNSVFIDKTLFSLLSTDEQVKCIASFVRYYSEPLRIGSWCDSSYTTSSLLKLVPPDNRLALIQSAIKEVYNLDFNDHAEFWCPRMLELLPTKIRVPYVEKIEKIVEGGLEGKKKLDSGCIFINHFEHFVYLYDSNVAFAKLKEILRKTPGIIQRERILVHLVKSCKINNDLKTLNEAVDYVVTRHRNDDASVIFRFIETIYKNFPISALNLTIFEQLDDLTYFIKMKAHGIDNIYNRWKEAYIFYRYEHNLDVENQIKNYFECVILRTFWPTIIENFKSKYAKFFILAIGKEAVNWLENQSSSDTHVPSGQLLHKVLEACLSYNVIHKKNKISLREIPGMEKLLQKILKEEYNEVGGEDWTIDIWERYYTQVNNSFYKPICLYYIFKRRPDLVEKYLKGIFNILFSQYYKAYKSFIIFLKNTASFFGITEKLKEIILNEFENGESIYKRKTALELYSHVCTIEEFSKAVEKYIPKQERLEKGAEGGFNEIQILVPSLIRHVTPGWKNLDLILKFFFGDFLKFVLISFNSCMTKTRSDVALTVLKKRLEEVPPKVSYIKDIIRLIFDISNRDEKREFFLYCWDRYKHYSVRTIVLRYVVRFFLDMPTPESFRVLETCVLNSDEVMSDSFPQLNKIPPEFCSEYVKALWEFSEIQKPNFRSDFRKNLLARFNEKNICFLSTEFCELIIKKNLFNPATENPVEDFTVLYVVSKPEAVEERILMVLGLIKDIKPAAGSVYRFLSTLLLHSQRKPADFADLFTILLENWPEYPPGVFFDERILFTYYNLHQKLVKRLGDSDAVPVELGKELRKMFSEVEGLNEFLPIYVGALINFFRVIGTLKAVVTLKELVAGSQDKTIAVLTVLSLPHEAVVWHKMDGGIITEDVAKGKNAVMEIIKSLESFGEGVVGIYLRSKVEFEKPPLNF